MEVLSLGTVSVDLAARSVLRSGTRVLLTSKEAEVLRYLAGRAHEDVSREDLYEHVWGYRPSVVSRTLDTTVHRLRTKIEPTPSDPTFLRTVHGFGYRLVLPGSGGSGWPDPWSHRTLHGRDAELAMLEQAAGPVLVTGPFGIGKTALLARYAAGREDIVWIEGGGRVDPVAALQAADPQAIVVIDSLVRVEPALCEAIAARGGRVRVGAREALGWRFERMQLSPLAARPAERMLEDVLQLLGVTTYPRTAVVALVERAEGIPVLLKVLASMCPALGVEAVASRIERGTLEWVSPVCHRVLPTVREAWAGLEAEDQRLLLFAAHYGTSVPAEVLQAALGEREIGFLRRVARLFDRSWLGRAERSGRISMYAHLRRCVLRVGKDEDLTWIDRAICDAGVALARQAIAEVDERPDVVASVTLMQDLRRCWRAGPDPEALPAVLVALNHVLVEVGSAQVHREWLAEVRERQPSLPPEVDAELALAELRLEVQRTRLVVPLQAEAVVELATSAGRPDLAIRALAQLGLYWMCRGDASHADQALERARAVAGEAPALRALASYAAVPVLHNRGDLDASEAALRQAHSHAVRAGGVGLVRRILHKLAVVLTETGQLRAARVTLEQASRLCQATEGRFAVGLDILGAQLAVIEERPDEAERLYLRAIGMCDDMQLHGPAAAAEMSLAWVYLAHEKDDQAITRIHSALDRWPFHRNPLWLGLARSALGMAHLLTGDPESALELMAQARTDLAQADRHLAYNHVLTAVAYARAGQRSRAREHLELGARWLDRGLDRLGVQLLEVVSARIEGRPEKHLAPCPYKRVVNRIFDSMEGCDMRDMDRSEGQRA